MTRRRGQGIVSSLRNFLVVSLSNLAVTLDTALITSHPLLRRHHVFAVRRCMVAALALLCFLWDGHHRAHAAEALPTLEPDRGGQTSDPLPAGVQLNQPEPATQPTMVAGWWFWTAVGAVAVATAAVIVASSRGSAPPTTNLGNQVLAP